MKNPGYLEPITISSFYGGVSDDPRKYDLTQYQIAKHFDIFSYPKKLTPYRDLIADANDGSTSTGMKQYFVRDFLYASASAKLYGLGQTAGGLTKIVHKTDAAVAGWTLPASSEGDGAVKNGCFFEFKDYIWGFQGTNQVFKYGVLSSAPIITNTVTTVASTITSVANGVIASDANAYMAYNNVIVRIAPGGTVTDSVKTVPANYKITSLTNYGNFLAIGCAPASGYNGDSKVFIWNLSSDLFQDNIPWGEGDLNILENIEGVLVGISDRYLNNSAGAGIGSMVIRTSQGGTARIFKEVFTQKLNSKTFSLSKAVKNNRLFFTAKIMTNSAGTTYNEGIWSFGRKAEGYPFALNLDVIDENVSTSGIQAFGLAANYFFIAHSADGSIDKTSSTATYTFTSIYESQIFNWGNPYRSKQLTTLAISTVALPLGGATVTAKYRVDGATAWTTIGSYSTVGGLSYDFMNIAASGAEFAAGKEYEIRLESTGGAEITGYTLFASLIDAATL